MNVQKVPDKVLVPVLGTGTISQKYHGPGTGTFEGLVVLLPVVLLPPVVMLWPRHKCVVDKIKTEN